MAFSKEDKQAWNDSEVMLELEKIAEMSFIPKEEGWEEEGLEEALENFEKPAEEILNELDKEDFNKELHLAHNDLIFSTLQKIAESFIKKSNIKVAYRIEQTIAELKDWRNE